jgi:hypothetical protein
MRLIETERGVSVVEDQDASGRVIYRVMRGKESLVPEYSLQDARHLAQVIRPRKVLCHKCGQTDIESFPAELGLGHLRVIGTGGWLVERFFGGETDFQDLAFCSDCAKKYHEDCVAWQQQTRQTQEPR